MRTKTCFLFCAICLLISIAYSKPSFCAPAPEEFKGEITGIAPKRITIFTEELLPVGESIQVIRQNKIIAILKVTSKNGKTITAKIITASSEVQFGDKLARFKPQQPQETKMEAQKSTGIPAEIPPPVEEKKEILPPQTENPEAKDTQPVKTEKPAMNNAPVPVTTQDPPKTIFSEPLAVLLHKDEVPETDSAFLAGYSFLGPRNIKFSNRGFKVELRKKFQDSEKFYDAVSYGEFTWNDQGFKLNANVFTFNFLYSLKPKAGATPFRIHDAYLTAGYSHFTARLSGAGGAAKKNTSGYNFGLSLRLLKVLNLDYQIHFFSIEFPNARMKDGEQFTLSLFYDF